MTDPCSDLVDFNEEASLDRDEGGREPPTPPWVDLLERIQDSDDLDRIVDWYFGFDRMIAAVKKAKDEAEDHLLCCMADTSWHMTRNRNIAEVTTKGGDRKGWKHGELYEAIHRLANRSALALPVQYDRDTGEAIDDRVLAVEVAIDAMRKACPSGAWTPGGISSLGLNPDEFSETSARVTTVKVTAGNPAPEPW